MGGALPLLVYDILINLSLTNCFLLLDWLPISSWTNFQTSDGGGEGCCACSSMGACCACSSTEGLFVLAPPWEKRREVSERV